MLRDGAVRNSEEKNGGIKVVALKLGIRDSPVRGCCTGKKRLVVFVTVYSVCTRRPNEGGRIGSALETI